MEKTTAASGPPQQRKLDWNGADDPANPKNWKLWRKWATLLGVSCFCLVTMLSSTMIAPAAPTIQDELAIEDDFVMECALSVYFLGMGVGPLLFGPTSEVVGRYPVLIAGNILYIFWNTVCGFAMSQGELIAFRFFTGIGASTPIALAGGIIGDLWPPENRGQAIAIYTCVPLLGPAIGPIAVTLGGFINQNITWRWIFWCFSITDAGLLLVVLCIVKESYAPRILHLKEKRQIAGSEDGESSTTSMTTIKKLLRAILLNLGRPMRMLTHSVVQILCFCVAVFFGFMYLLMFNYPQLWTEVYGEGDGVASLNYISIALGFVVGSQVAGALMDVSYRRLKKKHNGEHAPEYRIPVMMPASLMIPFGLLLYSWTGQYGVHWIVPNIGSFIFSAGFIICFQVVSTYTIDAYGRFAASALSTQAMARSLTAFFFPMFAPSLYSTFGIGWGNTLLALILLLIAVTVPFCLWRYGARLRAAHTTDSSAER